MKNRIVIFVLLILIVILAFFLRTYFCYNNVLYSGVIRYSDDGAYHMRFLENLLLGGHFPRFISFDPFTNFPYGSHTIAPLYDLILAFFIWLVSFGKPTLEIINRIAPFYPAIIGSLIPIVIYFIAKAIWDNPKISLTAALLVAVSSPILFRSILGCNDNPNAEILFSSLSMVFLFYALKSAQVESSVKNIKTWFFILMTGISMGLYLLSWPGAIIFFFIIFVFLVTYYLIEFFHKKPCNWILAAGTIIFLIPFLMMAPFLGHPDIDSGIYNTYHLLCFGLGLLGFLMLWAFGRIIDKKKLKKWYIFLFLAVSTVIFLFILRISSPYGFNKLLILFNGVNNDGVASSGFKNFVSEMNSLKFKGAMDNFSSLFFLYLLGFSIAVYDYLKEKSPKYLLLIIWSFVTLLITGVLPIFGQMRFTIYLAVNVSILSAFIVVKGFEFSWKSLDISSNLEKTSPIKIYFLVGSILTLASLVFFLIYPFPFNAGLAEPRSLPDLISMPLGVAGSPYSLGGDFYSLLSWLRSKTPDPGISYYDLYKEPGINKKTGELNPYHYPPQSYGILAQWDFGHAIVYYAHRLAVANPFQQGIGEKVNGKVTKPGEGVFFIETDESKATSYLDQLRAKYIITDSNLAFIDTHYFETMVKWVQGNMDGYIDEPEDSPTKYDNSMIARLHLLDGSGEIIENKINGKTVDFSIEPLKYFRLLYESGTTVRTLPYKNSLRDIKMAKVFEYVKGATIKGSANYGDKVNISADIITNQGRKFTYEENTIAENGKFEFIVPYSTGKQENSDTSASEYTIKIGDRTRAINVSEDDILQGGLIKI